MPPIMPSPELEAKFTEEEDLLNETMRLIKEVMPMHIKLAKIAVHLAKSLDTSPGLREIYRTDVVNNPQQTSADRGIFYRIGHKQYSEQPDETILYVGIQREDKDEGSIHVEERAYYFDELGVCFCGKYGAKLSGVGIVSARNMDESIGEKRPAVSIDHAELTNVVDTLRIIQLHAKSQGVEIPPGLEIDSISPVAA